MVKNKTKLVDGKQFDGKKSKKKEANAATDAGRQVNCNDSIIYAPPRFLTEDSLRLYEKVNKKGNPTVLQPPPPTPASDFTFEYSINSIPKQFPSLDNFEIPHIKEVGVKTCIEILADFFNCNDYKFNLIQFWFIDTIADCLWRLQNQFSFSFDYQKIILEWVLYMIGLIRDPYLNFSRKYLLQVFNEATFIAKERIQSSDSTRFPSPKDIFPSILDKKLEASASMSSFQTTSTTTSQSSHSLPLQFTSYKDSCCNQADEKTVEYFKPLICKWEDFMSSSDDESEELNTENQSPEKEISENDDTDDKDDDPNFYEPDLNTPDRFKLLLDDNDAPDLKCQNNKYKDLFPSNSNDLLKTISGDTEATLKRKMEKLLVKEELNEYKLWEQSYNNINASQSESFENEFNKAAGNAEANEIFDKLNKEKSNIEGFEKSNMFKEAKATEVDNKQTLINFCVLSIIKYLIKLHFSDSFQYTLVKFALRVEHTTVSKRVNKIWNKPREVKEEEIDEVVEKVEEKSRKKDKGKDKNKKGKKDKKKNKKDMSPDKVEISNVDQPVEEKEKKKIIPFLNNAVNDGFFMEIFENWTPAEKAQKEKGDKSNKVKAKKKK